MASKKKPLALNAAKTRIEELEQRLEEQKATNRALYESLEEARKEHKQFEEETSEYEGMRKFLLGKLNNKRPEYVNSLLTNVKESINTGISCKLASLKEELKSLENTHDRLFAEMRKAEAYKL